MQWEKDLLRISMMAFFVLFSSFASFLSTSLFKSQLGFFGAKFIRS